MYIQVILVLSFQLGKSRIHDQDRQKNSPKCMSFYTTLAAMSFFANIVEPVSFCYMTQKVRMIHFFNDVVIQKQFQKISSIVTCIDYHIIFIIRKTQEGEWNGTSQAK